MKTVVKVYRGIATEYTEWRASLGDFAFLIEQELHDELIRTEARPGGSRRIQGNSYEWPFGANATIGYALTIQYVPKRSAARGWKWLVWRLTRSRVRVVLITSVGRGPSR